MSFICISKQAQRRATSKMKIFRLLSMTQWNPVMMKEMKHNTHAKIQIYVFMFF